MDEITRQRDELAGINRELREAATNIKTLSGLLPICASCKKIRNDEGYWDQIEEYITKHSEANFSHGLCPDCMQSLYPDTYRRLQEKKAPEQNKNQA